MMSNDYMGVTRPDCQHFRGLKRTKELCMVEWGFMAASSGYKQGPLIRDHHLLHYTISGSGFIHVNGRRFRLASNQCFLVHPQQIVYFEFERACSWTYYWIGLCGNQVDLLLEQSGFSQEQCALPLVNKHICQTLSAMKDALPDHGSDLQLSGLLRILLYHMICSYKAVRSDWSARTLADHDVSDFFRTPDYARLMISLIQNSYSEDLRIATLASALGLSKDYLASVFRKQTGLSVRSYLTHFRMERASMLLQQDGRSIASIANLTGYDDPNYFSRVFAHIKGCSPREFRQANKRIPVQTI